MKHELVVTKLSGQESILVVAIDKMLAKDSYSEIVLFAPAIRAVVGNMVCSMWYDDEAHEVTIRRDVDAPPKHR